MFGTLRKLITYRHSGVIELQCINRPTEFRTRKNLRYKICLEYLTLQVRKLRSWELCGVCAFGIQRGSSSDYKFTSLCIWSFETIILKLSVSSFTQSCRTLCDPMDCSMPGFPVHHQLLKLAQTHVHRVGDAIQPSHFCHPLLLPLSVFLSIKVFPMSQFFASCGQSIRASASASDPPINIQDWFPLGWTGWVPLLSKGLSGVFSNTTVQKHQFFKNCRYWKRVSFWVSTNQMLPMA